MKCYFLKPQPLLRLASLHLHLEQIPHLQIHSIYSSDVLMCSDAGVFPPQNSQLATELATTTILKETENNNILNFPLFFHKNTSGMQGQ